MSHAVRNPRRRGRRRSRGPAGDAIPGRRAAARGGGPGRPTTNSAGEAAAVAAFVRSRTGRTRARSHASLDGRPAGPADPGRRGHCLVTSRRPRRRAWRRPMSSRRQPSAGCPARSTRSGSRSPPRTIRTRAPACAVVAPKPVPRRSSGWLPRPATVPHPASTDEERETLRPPLAGNLGPDHVRHSQRDRPQPKKSGASGASGTATTRHGSAIGRPEPAHGHGRAQPRRARLYRRSGGNPNGTTVGNWLETPGDADELSRRTADPHAGRLASGPRQRTRRTVKTRSGRTHRPNGRSRQRRPITQKATAPRRPLRSTSRRRAPSGSAPGRSATASAAAREPRALGAEQHGEPVVRRRRERVESASRRSGVSARSRNPRSRSRSRPPGHSARRA